MVAANTIRTVAPIIPHFSKANGNDRTPPPMMVATKLKVATTKEDFRCSESNGGFKIGGHGCTVMGLWIAFARVRTSSRGVCRVGLRGKSNEKDKQHVKSRNRSLVIDKSLPEALGSASNLKDIEV